MPEKRKGLMVSAEDGGITIESLIAYTKREALDAKSRTRIAVQLRRALFNGEPAEEALRHLAKAPRCFWEGIFFGRLSATLSKGQRRKEAQ